MRSPGTPAEPTNMAESREVCCSSPAAMCYWFATSLIAWGVLGVARVYWSPLHWYSASTILISRRNRLHSQLAEESLVSLCHHRTAVRHRSDSLLSWTPGPRAPARKFGMVTALRRNRRSVPVGMEIRKAFLTSARPSLIRPQPWFFPVPARWLLCCSSLSDHSGP
jgi:hypothetical protein